MCASSIYTDMRASELAEPTLPRPYRVVRKRRETADTCTLVLEPTDGPAPSFRAGQFNMLWMFGAGDVPISISGDPTRNGHLVHTIRAVGAATRALCAARRGDVVGVRGPYGSDWGLADAGGRDVVLVAGGIGLAPLRPALCELLADRRRYGRVVLLVGSRSPDGLLYRRELERWRGRLDLDVEVTVDFADQGWRGHVGVVTDLIPRATFEPSRAVALVCGPELMMHFTVRSLLERGVAPADIKVSMERNMKCAVGHCGHCQWGPTFVCRDGPVFTYERVSRLMGIRGV